MALHTIYHEKSLQAAAKALRKRHSQELGVRPATPYGKVMWSIRVTEGGASLLVSWMDEAATLQKTSEVL